MKLTYQTKALLLSILLFFVLTLPFTFFIIYLRNKTVSEVFEKCKMAVESLVRSVIFLRGNTVKSYFSVHFNNPKIYGAMEKAIEGKKEEARLELYGSLWKIFNTLREDTKVRDIQLILPDGEVLLRMRAPHIYGDYPSQVNPLIKIALEKGEYQEGFGTDGMLSGYVYAYPIKDAQGRKLGVVTFYLSLESIRSILKKLNPNTPYVFILKEDILDRIFPEYREYYSQIRGLRGWLIENPHRDVLDPVGRLTEKEERLLDALVVNREFLKSINTIGNHAMYLNYGDAHYKATVIKIREDKKEIAALIGLPPGVDIHNISKSSTVYISIFSLLAFLLSVFTFFYVNGIYRLKLSHRQLENLLSLVNAGVVVLDRRGRVVMLNKTACDILGYSEKELIGKVFHDVVHYHTGSMENCPIYMAVSKGNPYWGEDSFIRKDGKAVEVEVDVKLIQVDSVLEGAVVSFYDISERKKKEKSLYEMAVHDKLTGLYNRWYVKDFFKKELALMQRKKASLSLLILDVDDFKKINDAYGHNIGDEVLKALARIVKKQVRAYDLVARWGGEEFVVLLPNTDVIEAMKIAERVRVSVESFRHEDIPNFTVSIGVASYVEGDTLESLVERADNALYTAKREGKNRVVEG